MNAPPPPVNMDPPVWMKSTATAVSVWMVTQGSTVRQVGVCCLLKSKMIYCLYIKASLFSDIEGCSLINDLTLTLSTHTRPDTFDHKSCHDIFQS